MVTKIAIEKKLIKTIVILVSIVIGTVLAASEKPIKQKKNEISTPEQARVGYVVDGDTFAAEVLLASGTEISVRVRIMQIDAPEMDARCDAEAVAALASKNRLKELLPKGKIIRLQKIKDDKYLGRIDAYVYDGDIDIGDVMVREGHARSYNGGKRQPWCSEKQD